MNYADDDEVTDKYVEDCETQDARLLRQGYLTGELRKLAHATGSICVAIARPDGTASSYEGLTAETVAQVEAMLQDQEQSENPRQGGA